MAYSWDCRHCGKSVGFTQLPTKLIGNYHTVLCADCLNAFELYMRDLPAFTMLQEACLEQDILGSRTQGDGVDRAEEIKALADTINLLIHQLYGISEAWVLKQAPPSA